jgi:ABC-2 type transport system ATP-binding protein
MDATFRQHIGELRAAGRTVLLSSHVLSEVEALCDRVSIIRQGFVVESGSLAQLRHLTRTSVVAQVRSVPAGLEHLPGVHGIVIDGTRVSADVEPEGLAPLMLALAGSGLEALTTQPPTLEELFLRHYRDEPAPSGAPADAQPAQHGRRWGRRSA